MKESIFNMYFTADDGAKLAFNSYSCGLAVVNDNYNELIKTLENVTNADDVPEKLQECFTAAREGHFIVDDDYDELYELSMQRSIQKYSLDTLGLTIAPTLACNFKCIYCYETSKPGLMTEKTMQNIVSFVKAQSVQLKHLSICWYGGEPLIGKNIVYKLSESFLKICQECNIEYDAFMISNGSLINDEVIENLIQYRVNGIQITIDGPPEVHNRRRVNKQGTDTFNLIVENINKLLDTNKIDVVLRINVDKSNNSDVEQLIDILSNRLHSKDVKITFGQVSAYTEACKGIETSCYNNGEFATELLKYYELLWKHGFADANPFPYPEAKVNYCCADLANSFVVDHEGYLYKCWNEVGNTESSVGNLNDGIYDISNFKNGKWVLRNPIMSEKCSKCNLLPVCMGGCPHNAVVLKRENACDLIKFNVEDVMLKYYNLLKD